MEFLQLPDLQGKRVALLGAGGAARAAAYALKQLGAKVCIFNRTIAAAQELAQKYGFEWAPLSAASLPELRRFNDIFIQATSMGLKAEPGGRESDPVPFYDFTGCEAVFDLVYDPAVTPIMARAQQAGCRTQNGMAMLLAQAAEQRRIYDENE